MPNRYRIMNSTTATSMGCSLGYKFSIGPYLIHYIPENETALVDFRETKFRFWLLSQTRPFIIFYSFCTRESPTSNTANIKASNIYTHAYTASTNSSTTTIPFSPRLHTITWLTPSAWTSQRHFGPIKSHLGLIYAPFRYGF